VIRGQVTAIVVAAILAVLAGLVHPLLALAPLIVLGLPAALMLGSTIRRGDPYDVLHLYRSSDSESRPGPGSRSPGPGSSTPGSVGPTA
jgi:hypothetical protein